MQGQTCSSSFGMKSYYEYMYVCRYVCMYECMCVYVCMYACMYVFVRTAYIHICVIIFWDPHSSARTTHAGQEVSRGLYLTKGCKRIRQEKQSELPRQCVASWKEKRHDKDKGRYPSMNHHGNTCRSSSEIPNDVMQ